MIITEKQMDEAQAHYVDLPSQTTGFHLATALQRLGRKVVSIKTASAQDLASLPIFFADDLNAVSLKEENVAAAFFCADPFLTRNERPTDEALEQIISRAIIIKKNNPKAQILFLVPKNLVGSQLKKISDPLPKATIFVSPALYGFRDQQLFDKLLEQKHSIFPSWKIDQNKCDYLFLPDAIGFLIGALGNKTIESKIIVLPETCSKPNKIVDEFLLNFYPKGKTLFSTAASLLKQSLDFDINPSAFEYTKSPKALDLFPTALKTLERGMKECCRQYQQDPNQLMHFPPSKAP